MRWALEKAGLEWTDKRVSTEEFGEMKPSEFSLRLRSEQCTPYSRDFVHSSVGSFHHAHLYDVYGRFSSSCLSQETFDPSSGDDAMA